MKKKQTIFISAVIISLIIVSLFIFNKLKLNNSDEKRLKLAQYYLEKQDYDSAQRVIENILFKNPDNQKAKELLDLVIKEKLQKATKNSNTELDQSKPVVEKQIVIVQKEIEKPKELPEVQQVKQNETTKDNKIDEKLKSYNDLIKKGENEYKNGNYLKAIEYFNEAIKIKNDDYLAYQYIAFSYFSIDDGSTESYSKIQKNAEKSIELNKDAIDSYILLGQLYYKSKLYDKAKETFQKALSINPKKVSAIEGLLLSLIALEDYENAKKNAENLLERDPNNLLANQFLGKYYFNKENWDKSIEYLSKAIDKDKSNKEINIMLAKSYYMKKMYNQVISVIQNSIKNQPIYVEEGMWGALAYDKLGDKTSAEKFFNLAISSTNLYDNSYLYKTYFNYGLFLKNQMEYVKAINMFIKVIELEPKYLPAYVELGFSYFSIKDYDNSITYYEKAISLGEKSFSTFYNLGFAYYKAKTKKDLNKSLTYFNSALNENKNISDVEKRSDNFANIYTIIGNMIVNEDKTKAFQYYNLAVKYSSIYLETYEGILDCILIDKEKKLVDKDGLLKIIETGNSRIKISVETKSNVGDNIKRFYMKAALALLNYENYEMAYNYSMKAISIDKKYGEAYDIAINALIKLGRNEEAIKLIDIYLGFADEQKKNELLKILEQLTKK
ncbi:MAG: tetratricopeptide repeat protein [Exilispira sp.]